MHVLFQCIDTFQMVCKTNILGLHEENDVLKVNMAIIKKAVSAEPQITSDPYPSKIKAPEPKAFGKVKNAKEIENLLLDMDEYFKAARIQEERKL